MMDLASVRAKTDRGRKLVNRKRWRILRFGGWHLDCERRACPVAHVRPPAPGEDDAQYQSGAFPRAADRRRFRNEVCKFEQGISLNYKPVATRTIALPMTLRVYDSDAPRKPMRSHFRACTASAKSRQYESPTFAINASVG